VRGTVEDAPHCLVGPCQEGVERLVVPARLDDLPGRWAGHPLGERRAREDAPHEQRRLQADEEDQPLRPPLLQRLGGRGRLHQVVDGVLLALVEQRWRQPDLQALPQGVLGGQHQAADVATGEPHRVAVQVVADDLELAVGELRVEVRTRVDPPPNAREDGPDVADHASAMHQSAPFPLGATRQRWQ